MPSLNQANPELKLQVELIVKPKLNLTFKLKSAPIKTSLKAKLELNFNDKLNFSSILNYS